MATIADKMSEIMSIRVAIRQAYNIPKSVPFRDYLDYLTWFNETPPDSRVFADFTKSQYSKDGKIVRFEDIFGFERLSEATTFDSDGLEIWGVDEPRIVRGKGLLVEPESTNFLEDSFLNTGLAGFPIKGGGKAEVGKDGVGSYLKILKQESSGYWYKQYSDRESENGSHSLSYYSDTHNIGWGSSTRDLGSVGVVPSNTYEEIVLGDFSIYYGHANMESAGQPGRDRGFIKRSTHSDVEPKFYIMQLENKPFYTSPIKTGNTPVTRLPDILSLPIPRGHTIRGDWDSTLTLKVMDGKLVHEGIGYIRKLEVVPADSFEIDFLEDVTKSDTGVIHEGLYSFERLSEATTFSEDGLKVWGVDEPRVVEGKGLLIEPESTNQWTGSVYGRFPSGNNTVNNFDVKVEQVFGGPIPNESAVKVTKTGNNARYAISSGGMEGFHRSAFYKADASGAVGILNMGESAVPLSTEWERYSKVGSNNQLHLFDFRVSGNTLEEAYVVGLQLEEHLVTSHILTDTTPVTRLPDLLTLPSGYTVSGDYDEGVEVDGNQVSGFGYIRKLILEKK